MMYVTGTGNIIKSNIVHSQPQQQPKEVQDAELSRKMQATRVAFALSEPASRPAIVCSTAYQVARDLFRIQRAGHAFGGQSGLDLLECAFSYASSAVESMLQPHPRLSQCTTLCLDLHNSMIGICEQARSQFWGSERLSYLETAVKGAEQVWRASSNCTIKSVRCMVHFELGLIRKDRYLHLGHFDDLRRAVECNAAAIKDWEEGPLPGSICPKAARLAMRSAYADQPDDLDIALAIQYTHDLPYTDGQLEEGLSNNVGSDHAFHLNLLSRTSRQLYHRRSHLACHIRALDQSIEYAQRSCNHMTEIDPSRYEGFVELVTALMTRFCSSGARADDLDRAIEAATVATGLAYKPIYTNVSNPPRVCQRYICKTLDVAADVLSARFLRNGDPQDLDEAIHAARCVYVSTNNLDPSLPHQLQATLERYQLKLILLDGGTNQLLRVDNFMVRRAYLDRRSGNYTRSLKTEATSAAARRVVRMTQPAKALRRRSGVTVVLGYEPIYLDTQEPAQQRGAYRSDLSLSTDSAQYMIAEIPRTQATSSGPGINVNRITAARTQLPFDASERASVLESVIKWATANRDTASELDPVHQAMKLLDDIEGNMSRNEPTEGKKGRTTQASRKAIHSMLTSSCDPWGCILAFEADKELDGRTSNRMTESYQYKIVRLIREADEINARLRYSTTEWQDEVAQRSTRSTQAQFAQSSNRLIESIGDFRASNEAIPVHAVHRNTRAKCEEQALRGPIVYLFAMESASYAIILSTCGATILLLPQASASEVKERLYSTLAHLDDCQKTGIKGKANPPLKKFLEWLWVAIVEPIVQKLKLRENVSPKASAKLPLLRWIPTGIFSQVPLHAAGRYTGSKAAHISQYAVSSYLPSIHFATSASRRPVSDTDIPLNSLLTISMPETEPTPEGKLADIDAEREHRRILASLQGQFHVNQLIQPEWGTLESLLTHVRLAHFSCHGLPHATDPTLSRLVIWLEQQRPLTVAAIRKLTIPGARLAFISACHSASDRSGLTADPEADSSADEVVHVARAFQLAGFPTVVGTMWHAYQESAIEISGYFYRYLADEWKEEKRDLDGDTFARALHLALRTWRGEGGNVWKAVDWASWACFGY